MGAKNLLLSIFLIGCFQLHYYPTRATLSKSDRPKKEKLKKVISPPKENLLTENLAYEEILEQHEKIRLGVGRQFSGAALAYVAPWNNRGYTVAKIAADKFTHISPVWYQINSDKKGCSLGGTHDLDQSWISDVRRNNSLIKIVPRFLFDKWTENSLSNFITSPDDQDRCFKIVLDYVKRNKFDGAVIEIWSKVLTTVYQSDSKRFLTDTVVSMAETFHTANLEFILVVPPLHPGSEMQMFTGEDLEPLLPYVDYFSVMTYDFPSSKPVGVAPIKWVGDCMESLLSLGSTETSRKILMGLNFYGYEHSKSGASAITANTYLDLLRKWKPKIQWQESVGEHIIQHNGRVILFPSQYSLDLRLKFAQRLGVGFAIWEIGQGLDYFLNLL